MAENNNTREMERKTPSKVPVALVTHRQQDWDMDKRDNLPEKQNIYDHIDLGEETNTERSLPVGWSKGTLGPGAASYMACGGGGTAVLNETPLMSLDGESSSFILGRKVSNWKKINWPPNIARI